MLFTCACIRACVRARMCVALVMATNSSTVDLVMESLLDAQRTRFLAGSGESVTVGAATLCMQVLQPTPLRVCARARACVCVCVCVCVTISHCWLPSAVLVCINMVYLVC